MKRTLALLVALVGPACVSTRWVQSSGAPAVPLCDGGTADAKELTGKGFGSLGTESPLTIAVARECTRFVQDELELDWGAAAFVYRVRTDEKGRVTRVCAWSVPRAPDSSSCFADRLARAVLEPNLHDAEYRVLWFWK